MFDSTINLITIYDQQIVGAIIAVVIGWISLILVAPWSWLQQKINQFARIITKFSIGLNGRWLATFKLDNEHKLHKEKLSLRHLMNDKLTGPIKDLDTNHKYEFSAKIKNNEILGYYWATHANVDDAGNFKMKFGGSEQLLEGKLLVRNSKTNDDMHLPYKWRKYPYITKKVRKENSPIAGHGLFSNKIFFAGKIIGKLKLGQPIDQNKDTVKVGNNHRLVLDPWHSINHSCVPNAELRNNNNSMFAFATSEILPQDEITIDYRTLPEGVSEKFECLCPKCVDKSPPTIIGKI